MPIAAINFNNTPIFSLISTFGSCNNIIVPFLHINIRHKNLVKILYFIVFALHTSKSNTPLLLCNTFKRQEHENNATVFHTVESGAVPTLAHQQLLNSVGKA